MASVRTGGKGLDLEEALKAYFRQAGYFVVRGVPYRIEGDDITDIDLWLYERPAALTRRRLIVDVKNRRSPKVAERIIWTKGLQAALGVDGAIVATTDKRISARNLAKRLDVTLLDGEAVEKLIKSDQIKKAGWLRSEALDESVSRIDKTRRSGEWRLNLHNARASMIFGIGVQATNTNLAASGFFAEQLIVAQPGSDQAQTALRLFYLTSALAAISLDYALADQGFRSQEDRRQSIIDGIRYGESDTVPARRTIRMATALARKYMENGAAIAKQIENSFFADAERIPAEIIADHVVRISTSDALFNVAREIEKASSSILLPSYDQMTAEAKSLLGVVLDFNGVPREKVALGWTSRNALAANPKVIEPGKTGSLFVDPADEIGLGGEPAERSKKGSN